MKINSIIFCILLLIITNIFAQENIIQAGNNNNYDYLPIKAQDYKAPLTHSSLSNIGYQFKPTGGVALTFGQDILLNIGTDIECGFIRDSALYASFGLEAQIYKCSKIVFNISGKIPEFTSNNNWLFKIDLAPLYDSIKSQHKPTITYQKDSVGRPIDGNNHFVDWYKNLGSRVYYLGKYPIIEAYVGYNFAQHTIKTGRMKTIIGFDEQEMFWRDDAKFAPMSYWLTRDLFSGATYAYTHPWFSATIGIFSGGNPTKGYGHYLKFIESPNLKSNNTPTYAGRIEWQYGKLMNDQYNGYLYLSHLHNVTGSTWVDALNDGKRNASNYAYGMMFNIIYTHDYINSIKLFWQHTTYLSGLRVASAQARGIVNNRFRDIKQTGYFAGVEICLLQNKISLGGAYERFSRFDYNILAHNNFTVDNAIKDVKQTSYILHAKYFITPSASIGISMHKIYNPAKYVSQILDIRGDSKIKLSLEINF